VAKKEIFFGRHHKQIYQIFPSEEKSLRHLLLGVVKSWRFHFANGIPKLGTI